MIGGRSLPLRDLPAPLAEQPCQPGSGCPDAASPANNAHVSRLHGSGPSNSACTGEECEGKGCGVPPVIEREVFAARQARPAVVIPLVRSPPPPPDQPRGAACHLDRGAWERPECACTAPVGAAQQSHPPVPIAEGQKSPAVKRLTAADAAGFNRTRTGRASSPHPMPAAAPKALPEPDNRKPPAGPRSAPTSSCRH